MEKGPKSDLGNIICLYSQLDQYMLWLRWMLESSKMLACKGCDLNDALIVMNTYSS